MAVTSSWFKLALHWLRLHISMEGQSARLLFHGLIAFKLEFLWSIMAPARSQSLRGVCTIFRKRICCILYSYSDTFSMRISERNKNFIIRGRFSWQGTFWLTHAKTFIPLPGETLASQRVERSVTGGSWRLGTELHLVRRSAVASSWLNTEIWSDVWTHWEKEPSRAVQLPEHK